MRIQSVLRFYYSHDFFLLADHAILRVRNVRAALTLGCLHFDGTLFPFLNRVRDSYTNGSSGIRQSVADISCIYVIQCSACVPVPLTTHYPRITHAHTHGRNEIC